MSAIFAIYYWKQVWIIVLQYSTVLRYVWKAYCKQWNKMEGSTMKPGSLVWLNLWLFIWKLLNLCKSFTMTSCCSWRMMRMIEGAKNNVIFEFMFMQLSPNNFHGVIITVNLVTKLYYILFCIYGNKHWHYAHLIILIFSTEACKYFYGVI